MAFKFLGNVLINGKIRLITGLHIGTEKSEFAIGGMDNPIVKTVSGQPYIPGSSLKGKLRSLLEWDLGLLSTQKEKDGRSPTGFFGADPTNPVSMVFGIPASDEWKFGPSRLIVRDAFLSQESLEKLKQLGYIGYTEVKWENQIDRIKGSAQNLRHIERVPAGAEFEFSMVYRVHEVEDDSGNPLLDVEFIPYAFRALALLEDSYLGGLGTRGSGRVKFKDVVITVRPSGYYSGDAEEVVVFPRLEAVRLSKEMQNELVSKVKQALGKA